MSRSNISRALAMGAGLFIMPALLATPLSTAPLTNRFSDLAIQAITLDPNCKVTVTLANRGSARLPLSAYQLPGVTSLQSMTKNGPWGGATLQAMDPTHSLVQPGSEVRYSAFKRPLRPGEALRISMTLTPGGYRDANANNNRMTRVLRCPKHPGAATAQAGGRLSVQATRPGSQLPRGVVKPLFRITQQAMRTYTFPGSNKFHVDLQANMPFDPSSTPPGRVRVHARRYDGTQLTWSGVVAGSFKVNGKWLRWDSVSGPLAASCTSTPHSRCIVEFILFDGVLSSSGERLDGDGDGIPGGNYRHVFERGMP